MVVEDDDQTTWVRGDMTRTEIDKYAAMYQEKVHQYAKRMFHRYGRRLELEDIVSAGQEGLWRGLYTYDSKHPSGASHSTWIWRTIFDYMRSYCTSENHNRNMRRKLRCRWPTNPEGKDMAMDNGEKGVVEVVHDKLQADEIRAIAAKHLAEKDRALFEMLFGEELNQSEVARKEGVSKETISKRTQRVVAALQRVVARKTRRVEMVENCRGQRFHKRPHSIHRTD